MSPRIVELGSYAGTGARQRLEEEFGNDGQLTWISESVSHLVLHESHRCIPNPSVRETITITIEEIKSPGTEFIQARAKDIDTADREVVHRAHYPVHSY